MGEVSGGIVEIATVDGVYRPNGISASPTGTSDVDEFDQECDPYIMGYWRLACEEKAGDSLDELIENGSLVLLNTEDTENNGKN